jgi:hypothetical protein
VVQPQRALDVVTDRVVRVQGGERILEHHPQLLPIARSPLPRRGWDAPSSSTSPRVGTSSWVRIFAIVDLPLPDWPTSPIVWRAQREAHRRAP